MSKTKADLIRELRSLRTLLKNANEKHRIGCECYAELEFERDELKHEVARLNGRLAMQSHLIAAVETKPWYKRIFL